MFSNEIINFQHDVALLQYYIHRRQRTGFFDMERLIEVFAVTLFKATHDLDLKNMNFGMTNFPAIDLEDINKKAAVQVTTNATPSKIRKTILKYESLGYEKAYKKLYIYGFCDAAKIKTPDYCKVYNSDQITQELLSCRSQDAFQDVIDAIRRHHDYSRLHPYEDIDCLKIVLNCIDRNAVKHSMSCEGNYSDMISGLNEITELISKGQINKRNKSKTIDDFQDQEIVEYLRRVRDKISEILAIINIKKQSGSGFVCLDMHDMHRIDQLKRDIVGESNHISQIKSINYQISLYGA